MAHVQIRQDKQNKVTNGASDDMFFIINQNCLTGYLTYSDLSSGVIINTKVTLFSPSAVSLAKTTSFIDYTNTIEVV